MKIKSNTRVEIKLSAEDVAEAIRYYLESNADYCPENKESIASVCLSMVGFTIGPIGPNKKDLKKEVATFTFQDSTSTEMEIDEKNEKRKTIGG